jgi:hypothetical protein
VAALPERDALLLVFGDLDFGRGRLIGAEILKTLLKQRTWLVPRIPERLSLPIDAIFYQSAKGFMASARVVGMHRTTEDNEMNLPASMFPVTLELKKVDIFAKPVEVKPLINGLTFISNKKHWGHSFRHSPRMILRTDYNLVLGSHLPLKGG